MCRCTLQVSAAGPLAVAAPNTDAAADRVPAGDVDVLAAIGGQNTLRIDRGWPAIKPQPRMYTCAA
jgi:hypothetical protein